MRLIVPPSFKQTYFSVNRSTLKDHFKKRLFNIPLPEPEVFAGRQEITNAVIEFDSEMDSRFKIPELHIDGYKMEGIIPVYNKVENIYECYVDWFEKEI